MANHGVLFINKCARSQELSRSQGSEKARIFHHVQSRRLPKRYLASAQHHQPSRNSIIIGDCNISHEDMDVSVEPRHNLVLFVMGFISLVKLRTHEDTHDHLHWRCWVIILRTSCWHTTCRSTTEMEAVTWQKATPRSSMRMLSLLSWAHRVGLVLHRWKAIWTFLNTFVLYLDFCSGRNGIDE